MTAIETLIYDIQSLTWSMSGYELNKSAPDEFNLEQLKLLRERDIPELTALIIALERILNHLDVGQQH